MDFKTSKTYKNLKKAYADETQARVKYQFFLLHVLKKTATSKTLKSSMKPPQNFFEKRVINW